MIASSNTPPRNAASSTPPQPGTSRNVVVSGNEINSRDLFCSDRELVIAHGSDRYRLRLTSQNKLILTK